MLPTFFAIKEGQEPGTRTWDVRGREKDVKKKKDERRDKAEGRRHMTDYY